MTVLLMILVTPAVLSIFILREKIGRQWIGFLRRWNEEIFPPHMDSLHQLA